MPPWLIPLLLTAAGTYTTYRANTAAQKRTQDALLAGQRRQTELTDEASRKTVDFAGETYDPDTRAVNEEEAAQAAQSSLMEQITASRDRGMGTPSDATSGKITSGAYSTDRAKMVAKTLERASTLANLMGKTRGATDLRFNEGLKTAGLGGELADLSSLMRSRGVTDRGLTQIEGQVNPGQVALGSLMTGVGTAGLGSAANTGNLFGSAAPRTLTQGRWDSLMPTNAVMKGWTP